MNEEIEYAEMLEIPVSTVNVVKKQRRKKQKTDAPLKENVIAQVNQTVLKESVQQSEADMLTDINGGSIDFEIPDRIDTVRVYSADENQSFFHSDKALSADDLLFDNETEGEEPQIQNHTPPVSRAFKIALNAEFAAACALCGVIFFTNVFMPNSAINSFFRALHTPDRQTDARKHTEFTLSSVVGAFSDAELSLSPSGILTFTSEGCVYPAANGKVKEIVREDNGAYSVKIAYSDVFSGVFSGLDYVYYAVGDDVKANVPVGYSEGEEQVQVTMYSEGELLNCFELTEENCLAWISQT